ncbi:hypothetical protein, partial [Lacticaseibacillus paracasei]
REPAQKPTHKDLGRNDQSPAITSKAAYAPVSNRAGSRSTKKANGRESTHQLIIFLAMTKRDPIH